MRKISTRQTKHHGMRRIIAQTAVGSAWPTPKTGSRSAFTLDLHNIPRIQQAPRQSQLRKLRPDPPLHSTYTIFPEYNKRLGKANSENCVPIRLRSRLSLYFQNIGGASAKSNPKTAFSICLCPRLSLYLYPSTAGNDDSHSRQPMDTLPQKASWALTETCET